MGWYAKVIKNYVNFSGRARRKEYWMFFLFNIIITAVLEILYYATDVSVFMYLSSLYGLFILLPALAVLVRRLHDQNKSGGWFFISFIPLIGEIWLIVLLCLPGDAGSNRYGEDPKAGA